MRKRLAKIAIPDIESQVDGMPFSFCICIGRLKGCRFRPGLESAVSASELQVSTNSDESVVDVHSTEARQRAD
jgi:hypothetical protein